MIQLLVIVRFGQVCSAVASAIGETLRTMIPLILAGFSVAFAFRTGLFNIGVEGQLLVGWLAAVWFGYAVSLPAFLHIPLSILFAAWWVEYGALFLVI